MSSEAAELPAPADAPQPAIDDTDARNADQTAADTPQVIADQQPVSNETSSENSSAIHAAPDATAQPHEETPSASAPTEPVETIPSSDHPPADSDNNGAVPADEVPRNEPEVQTTTESTPAKTAVASDSNVENQVAATDSHTADHSAAPHQQAEEDARAAAPQDSTMSSNEDTVVAGEGQEGSPSVAAETGSSTNADDQYTDKPADDSVSANDASAVTSTSSTHLPADTGVEGTHSPNNDADTAATASTTEPEQPPSIQVDSPSPTPEAEKDVPTSEAPVAENSAKADVKHQPNQGANTETATNADVKNENDQLQQPEDTETSNDATQESADMWDSVSGSAIASGQPASQPVSYHSQPVGFERAPAYLEAASFDEEPLPEQYETVHQSQPALDEVVFPIVDETDDHVSTSSSFSPPLPLLHGPNSARQTSLSQATPSDLEQVRQVPSVDEMPARSQRSEPPPSLPLRLDVPVGKQSGPLAEERASEVHAQNDEEDSIAYDPLPQDFSRVGDDREEDILLFSTSTKESTIKRRCTFLDPLQPGRPLSCIEDFLRSQVLPLFGSLKLSVAAERQLASFRNDAKNLLRQTCGATNPADGIFFTGDNSLHALSRWIDVLHLRHSRQSAVLARNSREGNVFDKRLAPLRMSDGGRLDPSSSPRTGGAADALLSAAPVVFLVRATADGENDDPMVAMWKETVAEIVPVSYSSELLHRRTHDHPLMRFAVDGEEAQDGRKDNADSSFGSYIDETHLERLLQSCQNRPLRIGCFRMVDPLSGRGANVGRINALMHKYGAIAIWDVSLALAHMPSADMSTLMKPSTAAGGCDVIVGDLEFSPGGQSSCGILIVSHRLLGQSSTSPSKSGGRLLQGSPAKGKLNKVGKNSAFEEDIDYANVPSLSQLVDALVYIQHFQLMEAEESSHAAHWMAIIRTGLVLQWRQTLSASFCLLRPFSFSLRAVETLFAADPSFFLIDAPCLDNRRLERLQDHYDPSSFRLHKDPLVGKNEIVHLPSIAFLMVHTPSRRFFHPQFTAALLRDLFGIRVSVVRPFGARALCTSMLHSAYEAYQMMYTGHQVFASHVSASPHRGRKGSGDAGSGDDVRPIESILSHLDDVDACFAAGWISMSLAEIAVVEQTFTSLMHVLQFVSQHAIHFLPFYGQDAVSGEFRLSSVLNEDFMPQSVRAHATSDGQLGSASRRSENRQLASLHLDALLEQRTPRSSRSHASLGNVRPQPLAQSLDAYLDTAIGLATRCSRFLTPAFLATVVKSSTALYGRDVVDAHVPRKGASPFNRLPWFVTPVEACEFMNSGCIERVLALERSQPQAKRASGEKSPRQAPQKPSAAAAKSTESKSTVQKGREGAAKKEQQDVKAKETSMQPKARDSASTSSYSKSSAKPESAAKVSSDQPRERPAPKQAEEKQANAKPKAKEQPRQVPPAARRGYASMAQQKS